MRIIFISGDGHGAGKTFLAKKLVNNDKQIFSIANLIRMQLAKEYPNYDWYNKSPEFKEKTKVKETSKTVHEMLDIRGKEKKSKNSIYWAKEMVEILEYNRDSLKIEVAVIDDVRYVDEFLYIKNNLKKEFITHIHVINPKAKPEPLYENSKLKEIADYHILSQKVLHQPKS